MKFEDIMEVVAKNFPGSPRENQLIAASKIVYEIIVNNKKHVILDAPTGSGKSYIAVAVARSVEELFDPSRTKFSNSDYWSFKTTILTTNRNLQTQYLTDFPFIRNISSKVNYPCAHGTTYGASSCFITVNEKKCDFESECSYYINRSLWQAAPLRITNMSFQIEACKAVSGQSKNRATFMIIDECHMLGQKIQDHCKVQFNSKDVDDNKKYLLDEEYKLLKNRVSKIQKLIKDNTSKANLVKIASENKEIFTEIMNASELYRERCIQEREGFFEEKKYNKIHEISKTIDFLGELSDMAELMESNLNRLVLNDADVLRPIWPSHFSYYAIFKKADYFLHMSATICNPDSYAEEVGIRNYAFVQMPNSFPVENRPVFVKPVQKVSTFPLNNYMIKEIDKIAAKFDDSHGIIHTVSFARANQILENSKNKERMFISNDRNEIIERLTTDDNSILVSPSITEGFDFKDDMSKFQIIVKVPYASTLDLMNAKIFDLNKPLYFRRAVLNIVQSSGRSIRHKDDFAETYILDTAFFSLIKYNEDIFPEWYREALDFVV